MAQKTNFQIYDEFERKRPEEFREILSEMSCDISYHFLYQDYLKDETCKCIDYGKIISKVKWPDSGMKRLIDRSDLAKVDNPLAFLIAGTVIKIEQNSDGRHKVYLSDDETLWNNTDDYDQLVHIKNTIEVQHCIVALELFTKEQLKNNGLKTSYTIGDIDSIRPGTRIIMPVFLIEPTSNELWLRVAFTDIKRCSADISRLNQYYREKLDNTYRLINKDEYLQNFVYIAEANGFISTSNGVSNNSEGCYIATCVYGSYDCPQVWTLRRFRDFTLYRTWYGRAFIRMYYRISPKLVKWFGGTDWFKTLWRGKLDELVKRLQDNGMESTPYKDRDY